MTYNDLRRSIYESYQSGEISGPQATQMLEKVMDIEGDHIVAEYEALESTFMGVAMEAANGYMDFTDFQEQAQVYTEGVKEIWTKFLDWIKGIISAIFGIEFKGNPTIEVNGDKVSLYQKFTNFCKKITSGKTDEGLIAGLVGLAATAGASIFAGHKVKMKYKKFAEIQKAAVDSGKDVVTWMADPDNAENETLKQIGSKGQAAIKKIFEAVKQDKQGVVGRIYKWIGKKIGITKEELDKLKQNHTDDDAVDGDTVPAEEEDTVAATAAVPPVATHAGTEADGTYSDVNKNKKKYKDMFGKNPPDDATAEEIATALQTKVALERKKIDTTGDVFTESSSWDDIFAYMDI
jgi:hypothetical protein